MLSLKNICWTAPDGKQVLKNINLDIDSGKLVVITGPNGGGKTTLARVIAGIEPALSGQIFLDGEEITNFDVTQRARKGISFAFQQPVRFKGITVKNLLEIAAGEKLDKGKLCDFMSSVGLCAQDYLGREIDSTLSGGEIKRIEIATVLARHKKLSIFDEPEAGIDLWSFKNLIQSFQDIHEKLNGTLVIISHQERILKIADEIIIIADGEVQDRGPGSEMLKKMFAHQEVSAGCCKQEELFNE